MTMTIKQEKDEEEEAVVVDKKNKKSSDMKVTQEVDEIGTRVDNTNITVKQEDDNEDLNSRTNTVKGKEMSAQKQHKYYESSYTEASSINYIMNHIEANRPFGCDLCEMRYKRADHLRQHVRRHTGERPYACMYCPKTFYRCYTRHNHEQMHRGDRQYECERCDAKFVTKISLTLHSKRRHPASTPYIIPL